MADHSMEFRGKVSLVYAQQLSKTEPNHAEMETILQRNTPYMYSSEWYYPNSIRTGKH